MRALVVRELGEPIDVLQLSDVPEPSPGPGQVRLRVEAAALNFADTLVCKGQYQEKPLLPFTPGMEVAGTIEALGDGVADMEGLAVGARVLATPLLGHGGYAEHTLAEASLVAPIGTMPFDAAAALRITYYTGHVALHRRGRLQPGETVLVHAGAGGVGSAAIQLARAHGCAVIATAGGADKVALCRELGADLAIDYRAGDFVDAVKEFTDGRGADVIFDPVGGDTFDRSTKCVAWEGRILVIGFASGRIPEAKLNHILVKSYSVVGVHWGSYAAHDPQHNVEIHEDLVRLHDAGLIDPIVTDVVGLAHVPEALTRLVGRGTTGKVVAHPWS